MGFFVELLGAANARSDSSLTSRIGLNFMGLGFLTTQPVGAMSAKKPKF
jgi:hypothetical protein